MGWNPAEFTRMEKMFILSIQDVMLKSGIRAADSQIIFSTTKGNIDLLEEGMKGMFPEARLRLWKMAEVIASLFGFKGKPLVVSNACISGSLALITASRMVRSGSCDHVIVTGGDLVTEFVASGFQSFQALSPGVCKPFDAKRDGLSLGEGAGTLLLTRDKALAEGKKKIKVAGGSVSNDANHISGPSRDGEGLWLAIEGSLKEAGVAAQEVDFISAHGTATPYNDEMEAKALAWAGLQNVPVNSFKGYFGHTLGAAGVIESILTIHSLQHDHLIKSLGYENHGVSVPLNIITKHQEKEINTALKTASGFGGCNAGIVFRSI
jgi:3-oxoacyl-[acyl-carrier-protein] synthase-1